MVLLAPGTNETPLLQSMQRFGRPGRRPAATAHSDRNASFMKPTIHIDVGKFGSRYK
jgi:hypothetical protein